jgi:hypothetical membrane protein
LAFLVSGLVAAIGIWAKENAPEVLVANLYVFLWYFPSAAMYWIIWRRRGKSAIAEHFATTVAVILAERFARVLAEKPTLATSILLYKYTICTEPKAHLPQPIQLLCKRL